MCPKKWCYRWVMTILTLFLRWIQHLESKSKSAIGRSLMSRLQQITSMCCGARYKINQCLYWFKLQIKEAFSINLLCGFVSRSTGNFVSHLLWCLLRICFGWRTASQIYLNLMMSKAIQGLTNKEHGSSVLLRTRMTTLILRRVSDAWFFVLERYEYLPL